MHACKADGRSGQAWLEAWESRSTLGGRLGVVMGGAACLGGRLQVHGEACQAWLEAWGSRCTLDRSLGIAMHASGSLKQGPIKKNIKYIKKKVRAPIT
jgi:hypothetical protein